MGLESALVFGNVNKPSVRIIKGETGYVLDCVFQIPELYDFNNPL